MGIEFRKEIRKARVPLMATLGLGGAAFGISHLNPGYTSVNFSSCDQNASRQGADVFAGIHRGFMKDVFIAGYRLYPREGAEGQIAVTAKDVPVNSDPIRLVEGNPYYLRGTNPHDGRHYEIVIDKEQPKYPKPNVHISTTCE